MNKYPYFPFYPRDFDTDGNVAAMSTLATGAYFLIICKAWDQEPVGTVPNNDVILSRWARLSMKEWEAVRPEVLAAFRIGEDGRLHQKRLKSEYEKLLEFTKKKKNAGKSGARKRWNSNDLESPEIAMPKHRHQSAIGLPMADGMANDGTTLTLTPSGNGTPPTPQGAGGGAMAEPFKGSGRKARKKLTSEKNAPIDYPLLFDMFWDHYPRHDSKKEAFAAFQKIAPPADVELVNRMIVSIGEQAKRFEWTKERARFIPQATTWLNQRRWEQDEGSELSLNGDKNLEWGKKKYGVQTRT